MKIAFRISKMGFGGAERVFLSVAKVLKDAHNVEIHFIVDRIQQAKTEHLVTELGCKLVGLSSDRTMKTIKPFKAYIDTEKPDILISAYTDTNLAAIVSAKLAKHRCKVIVSEHSTLKEHWQRAPLKRRLLLKAYVRFGYRFADHLLAVSKGLANQLLDMGHQSSKVSFIYNPVRFRSVELESKSKASSQPLTILAVGRIAQQKDYLTLLKAINILKSTLSIRLVVVGGVFDPAEKAKLDQFVDDNDLKEFVDFVGFKENVDDYYKQANLFVLSSAWEGFGNVIIEAMAYGLPIVSTDCNHGPAEILEQGKYGKLVPVGDFKALAGALEDVLNQRDTIDTKVLKQRSLTFSEENIANQYWKLILEVMA